MAKSVSLRAEDWRGLILLVGECREMGDDGHAWRLHLAEQLAHRVSGDICYCGELVGCGQLRMSDLGVTDWGWQNGFDRAAWLVMLDLLRNDPRGPQTIIAYLGQLENEDGVCLARSDLMSDRDWNRTADARMSEAIGTDHALFCFRSIPGAPGVHSVIQFHRATGHRDFSRRDLAIVREAHAALAPLIGGPLARFAEPSASGLPVRMRRVLSCILEGDGDKQVAARLGLSVHTVNEYTKAIFRHFNVRSRPELLARWVRRGWGSSIDQRG